MMSIPSDIKPIIEELMGSPKFKKRWTEHLIQSKWVEWVGKRFAQHISPGKLKDGRLTVLTDDEKWIKPFEEFNDRILEKIKKDLGHHSVIGFTIMMDQKRPGTKRQKKRTMVKAKNKDPSKIPSSEPDQSLDKDIEKELNRIKDPAIKTAFRRLIIKSKSFNQK